MSVSSVSSVKDAKKADECKRSFEAFVREYWSCVPGAGELLWNWHMVVFCKELQNLAVRVRKGEQKPYDLVINVCFGTSKSMIVSILFHAWVWAWWPQARFLVATHTDSLVQDLATKAKDVITSEKYKANFPQVKVRLDRSAKEDYHNTLGGERKSCTVGGKTPTGRHAHIIVCLPGETRIITDIGELPIREIVDRRLPVNVLGYDHIEGRVVWKPIESFERSPGRVLTKVVLDDGTTLEATEDHPIYEVNRGYVWASSLCPGDKVIHVREVSGMSVRGTSREAGGTKDAEGVLFPKMLGKASEGSGDCSVSPLREDVLPKSRRHGKMEGGEEVLFVPMFPCEFVWEESPSLQFNREGMRPVRGTDESMAVGTRDSKVLQFPVSRCSLERCGASQGSKEGENRVRVLRNKDQNTSQGVPDGDSVLFEELCEQGTFGTDGRKEQSELRPWAGVLAVPGGVCPDSQEHQEAGGVLLFPLREGGRGQWPGTRCSSYRLEQKEQLRGKSGRSVSMLSYGSTGCQIAAGEEVEATVMDVTNGVRIPEEVFNLGVADVHNYFANGVLVHNCDDPIDPQGARSEAELETAKKFMTEVVPSRAVNKVATPIILVMQRLHPRDPTQVMLDIGKAEGTTPVRHYCFPGEITDGASEVAPPECAKYYIDGLMDPVRLPRQVLNDYRQRLGPYGYAGQVLQNPTPPGGGRFKLAWFQTYERAAPYASIRIRYWDRAASRGADRAATAGVLMARGPDGRFYVEHVVHGRWEPNERNDVIVATAQKDRTRYGPKHEPIVYVETERGSTGLESFQGLARRLAGFPIREDSPSGSKDSRAEPWADQLAAGNVVLVRPEPCDWDIPGYIDEHLLFRPDLSSSRMGRFKDRVDSSCLIAGTSVETANGPKPIEDICAGDLVLTRYGYKEVEWAGQSGWADRLVSVEFANGSVVTGTPEHLVWTENKGWVRLDSCSGGDCNLAIASIPDGENQWLRVKSQFGSNGSRGNIYVDVDADKRSISKFSISPREYLSTYGDIIGDSLTQKSWSSTGFYTIEGQEECTSRVNLEMIPSTGRYGVFITETSPRVATSIIRTATLIITTSRILSALLRRIIPQDIPGLADSLVKRNTFVESERRRRSGIDPKRGLHGIELTEKRRGKEGRKKSTNASSAERNSFLAAPDVSMEANLDIAPPGAETSTDDLLGTKRFASGAERVLSARRKLPDFVPIDAPDYGSGAVPVYDITVRDAHEFFANGILVHNSAAHNLLAGRKVGLGMARVYAFTNAAGAAKGSLKRLVVCRRSNLKDLVIEDHPCLLVFFEEPLVIDASPAPGGGTPDLPERTVLHEGPELSESSVQPEGPPLGLAKLLDVMTVRVADLDPADCQATWGQVHPLYAKKPEDVILSREQGKRLWNFLLKKRDVPWEIVLLVGETRLPLSVAFGAAYGMGLDPARAVYDASPDASGDWADRAKAGPPNKYAADMIRRSRGLVIH